jgi:CRP-like cAMP-binding protein
LRIDWLREPGLPPSSCPALRLEALRDGELIFAPAASPESVYLLETGLARVYRVSEAGCETSFGYVAPGEVLGELAAFGDDSRESFAQAVQASLVWRIAREPFQRLMASRPSLVLAIAQQMGERLKRVEARRGSGVPGADSRRGSRSWRRTGVRDGRVIGIRSPVGRDC